MNLKIKVNGTTLVLNDKSYLASGGEGSIYVNGGKAFKIYHNDTHVLPLKKIQELSLIPNPSVITPQEIIYSNAGDKPIGYTTTFIDNVEPFVKYFTKTFKDNNNVSMTMMIDLIKKMRIITSEIHGCKCLIVDYNELNILIKDSSGTLEPYFIDCDSYQTPSYKSSAVMQSIMDRRVSSNLNGHLVYNPDELSDWFSWGVLSFNALVNIHPYRGTHPNYKPNQKKQQMDDNISVFDPKSRMPPSVTPFNIIPKRLLDWYKFIFSDTKNRSVPPDPDSSVPLLVPTQVITIQGTDNIGVEEIASYDSNIQCVFTIMGIYYIATKSHIYASKKEIETHDVKWKTLLCASSDGTLIAAQQGFSNKILFNELTKSEPIGTATSNNMFARNNAIYTISRGKLVENSFTSFGHKIVHRINEVENVSTTSAEMYDGCVIQNLLGKIYLTLPYKLGSCFSKHMPQLDGYRVVGAKSDKYVTVVLGEKNGQYDRFIIVFDKQYSKCDIRKVDDVSYDTINFAVMDNGLCALLANPTELELFTTAFKCETISNPPLDSTMKLIATPDGLFFINGNSLHQIKRK
jgi:hypothetical protein